MLGVQTAVVKGCGAERLLVERGAQIRHRTSRREGTVATMPPDWGALTWMLTCSMHAAAPQRLQVATAAVVRWLSKVQSRQFIVAPCSVVDAAAVSVKF